MTNDFKPCDHPGCMSHISHPCEGCGRQWGIEKDLNDPNFGLKLGMALREADEEFWFKRRLMRDVVITKKDLEDAKK